MTTDDNRLSVPAEKQERDALLARVRQYVASNQLVPPLSIEEMQKHADRLDGVGGRYSGFLSLLIGNEVWRDTLAAVPFERRVLLLPQCLRSIGRCAADADELGLLCEDCGACSIGAIQAEAEALGYVVLVAQGTTVVTKLLEQGTVDAVVGVSCMSVLEKSFPCMAAEAIPGIAIPLLQDGCEGTSVDVDWVQEALRLKSDQKWLGRPDIERIRDEVASWFDPGALPSLMGDGGGGRRTVTEDIALAWLSRSGKRWRPVLATCVYQSLQDARQDVPEPMRRLAVAIECFHKASLIHDDIEDDDHYRYGEATLHRQYGVPIALNAGDFLVGEGYRLIAGCGAEPPGVVRMLRVAAEGHRNLCIGQGQELAWVRDPQVPRPADVIEIFRRKTAPAFEVALRIGAIYGGAAEDVCPTLSEFSEALGVAYQIKDDIDDVLGSSAGREDGSALTSILAALAYENGDEAARRAITDLVRGGPLDAARKADLRERILSVEAEKKAHQLLEHFKNQALRALNPLGNARLKSLLRRLVGKILGNA